MCVRMRNNNFSINDLMQIYGSSKFCFIIYGLVFFVGFSFLVFSFGCNHKNITHYIITNSKYCVNGKKSFENLLLNGNLFTYLSFNIYR